MKYTGSIGTVGLRTLLEDCGRFEKKETLMQRTMDRNQNRPGFHVFSKTMHQ